MNYQTGWVPTKEQLRNLLTDSLVRPLGELLCESHQRLLCSYGRKLRRWDHRSRDVGIVFVAYNPDGLTGARSDTEERVGTMHFIMLSSHYGPHDGTRKGLGADQVVEVFADGTDELGIENPLETPALPSGVSVKNLDSLTKRQAGRFTISTDPEVVPPPEGSGYKDLYLTQRCLFRQAPLYSPFSPCDGRAQDTSFYDVILYLQEVLYWPLIKRSNARGVGDVPLGLLMLTRRPRSPVPKNVSAKFRSAYYSLLRSRSPGERAVNAAADGARKVRATGFRADFQPQQGRILKTWYAKRGHFIGGPRIPAAEIEGLLQEHMAAYRQYLSLDRYCVRQLSSKLKKFS